MICPERAASPARQTQAVRPVAGRWRQFALVTLALSTDVSEASILATLYPVIAAQFGLTSADLGTLTAAGKLTAALCSPVWAWLAQRWSRKGVLVVAAGLWGAWGVALGFATSFPVLLVLFCVLAAGYGGAPGVATAVVADLFEDGMRSRAVGVLYLCLGAVAAAAGPLIGQLARIQDGWRFGLWGTGALGVAVGLLMWARFRDPGYGASEAALPAGSDRGTAWAAATGVFRIPSFNLMLLSRLLSGHLVIATFGVVFLTEVRNFSTPVAVLVLMPFGIGYCCGNGGGALLVERLHVRFPRTGRVAFLQAAQFGFAFAAYLATQVAWEGIGRYMAFWFAMGLLQGVNPCVNRPIVMAVVAPALRAWAFTIMLTIVEPIGWAAYCLAVGWLGERYGLQPAFLAVLVGVMLLNGLAIAPLYLTYGRDVARVNPEHPPGERGPGGGSLSGCRPRVTGRDA